jgi:hypothetical protein
MGCLAWALVCNGAHPEDPGQRALKIDKRTKSLLQVYRIPIEGSRQYGEMTARTRNEPSLTRAGIVAPLSLRRFQAFNTLVLSMVLQRRLPVVMKVDGKGNSLP